MFVRGIVLVFALTSIVLAEEVSLHSIMPQKTDWTQMWWAEGFPTKVDGASWRRVIETGNYRLELDTETLKLSGLKGNLELGIEVDGKNYKAVKGGEWTRFTGPRLIESGRFFQRMDVTNLLFRSRDGEALNTEARLEVAAWPNRLGLILAAEPGFQAIQEGEASFGKRGGGYGLSGENDLIIPHEDILDLEEFRLDFWAFVPNDYLASKLGRSPWLVCKNRNEAADGNFGVMIVRGKAVAKMNIGGPYSIVSRPLRMDVWNRFELSYDGDVMRFSVNGRKEGEVKIGKKRKPGRHALVFGRREDSHGDGYPFRGIVDEIRFFRGDEKEPVRAWEFRKEGRASETMPREVWKDVRLNVRLGELRAEGKGLNEVALSFDPATFEQESAENPVKVKAEDRPVEFDYARGWHRINLDGMEPEGEGNDVMEKLQFKLTNTSDSEQVARLMFEKTARGIRHRFGVPITGVSAVLRDADGNPCGIPVQLSKNWHNDPEGGVYSGQWFHGISQVRMPPKGILDFELVLVYGHWGGVPAASHAQLSLVGWGGNSLWDQSALGAWGESICYDPDQAQADSTITDVRPLMVKGKDGGRQWHWTNNVGGGDFFRFFDPSGKWIAHSAMRTTYHKQGPCLTEVTYEGKLGGGITHSVTASLGRTDDVVRGTYRIRLDVEKATDFSRFVIFQIGSDTYNHNKEKKLAIGNVDGLTKEWPAQWGGNDYKTESVELKGRMPWVSMHEAVPDKEGETIANRGLVIREWRARLGGKESPPLVAERGLTRHKRDSSTIDILPPANVTRLEPGDFVEATIEYIVMPQSADDYYGPNEELRTALKNDDAQRFFSDVPMIERFFESHGKFWGMIHREAAGNDRLIEMEVGELKRLYPDIKIIAEGGRALFQLKGGLGHVPLTVCGLKSHRDGQLFVDGKPVNQSVHGKDYWQSDYDPVTQRWSRTYTISIFSDAPRRIRFGEK